MDSDIAFINATVHTVDAEDSVTEAILIRGGRISLVGTNQRVLKAAAVSSIVYDASGMTIVPGFIDPHNHLSQTALIAASIDCSGPSITNIDELLQTIQNGCRNQIPGQWVRGVGFWAQSIREGRGPTREELDEASPENPFLLIEGSVHRGFANSAALAEAGIDDYRPQPWGGLIEFDHMGRPTGVLLEAALDFVSSPSWRGIAAKDWVLTREMLKRKMSDYAESGITSICDAAVTPDAAELFARADRAGDLLFTVQQLHTADGFFGHHDLRRKDFIERVRGRESDRLRGGTMKIFVDHGYPDGPPMDRVQDGCRTHTGTSFYGRAEVKELVLAANALGIRTAIHAMGNWAVDTVLEAYEAVRRSRTFNDGLLRIEHAFVAAPATQAPRMAELGVDLVSKPGIIYETGPMFDQVWRGEGQDHLTVMPIRSMIDAGVRVSFASDAPAGPFEPAQILWGAISRESVRGDRINPEEAVSPVQALRCSTINAAHAAGRGSEEGSLEIGKRANLAILDRDILTCPTDDIRQMRVLATLVDGRTVHQASDGPRPLSRAQLVL